MEKLFNEGMAYMDGVGVTQDIDKGIGLIKQSAQQGYADAQYFLGLYNMRYLQDIDTAISWFRIAARQGDERAKIVLEEAGLS